MISVDKNYNKPPDELKDIQKKIEQFNLTEYSLNDTLDSFFTPKNKTAIKEALSAIYHNKCAYCECNPTVGSYTEIEHYRPKKGGYYWLAFEWSNLLLSCTRCNKSKSNKFPLKDESNRLKQPPDDSDRKATSDILLSEQPLLLNPEVTHKNKNAQYNNEKIGPIEKHLEFNKNGEVNYLTDEGKETIEVFKLNKRPELVIARRKVIKKYIKCLKNNIEEYAKSNDFFKFTENVNQLIENVLKDADNPEKEYLQLRRQIVDQPDNFFKKAFEEKKIVHIYDLIKRSIEDIKASRKKHPALPIKHNNRYASKKQIT
ncbi:hypothetical protein MHK_002267 [Candidatus Magnetomorum sp. HK-1]|nr:hypothetical protein MHK_002267 [Candidatus Magnetomorum sp. HK-1]